MEEDLDIELEKRSLEEQREVLISHLRVKPVSHLNNEITRAANPDHTDLAQEYFSQDRRTALREIMEGKLVQVEGALERIEQGVYGRCEHCGKNISTARLEVIPYTELCIECQEEQEKEINNSP
ncbi:MAG: TraR/DksA family transcriptional regulator [Anaerolineales bacterium]|nr:TraR/DksA family transcriptional regulator [Anaerolineales bacterium]